MNANELIMRKITIYTQLNYSIVYFLIFSKKIYFYFLDMCFNCCCCCYTHSEKKTCKNNNKVATSVTVIRTEIRIGSARILVCFH